MIKITSRKKRSKLKLQVIFNEGVKFVSKSFIAFFLFSEISQLEPTIIASKKVGNAIKRNRCKRRLREIIRLHIRPNIGDNIRLILIARAGTDILEFSRLLSDCNNLIKVISKKD